MLSDYQEKQRAKAVKLAKDALHIFNGAKVGKKFLGFERDFVLTEGADNFFKPIYEDVLQYFCNNQISWWNGSKPTGHLLSSQIACLNHLFAIRNDREAVLSLLSNISPDFIDVLTITTDNFKPSFIQFETVSDYDYLNEGIPTRGNNCTSIDALIYAVHKDGARWLIPIEWKFTEHYKNQNKANEGCKKDPLKCKGEIRKKRYTQLINESNQLRSNDHACYYFEPFYQLMRQTLWAEQMIKHKQQERIKADNFMHLHIIPSENNALLHKVHKCSSQNMEDTWRSLINDQTKYAIVTPRQLLSGLHRNCYASLIDYLTIRYW